MPAPLPLPAAQSPAPGKLILETERLRLREFTLDDAAFMLEQLNDPLFHRHIGDKGVRTPDDARRHLGNGPIRSYRENGFGLWRVELKSDGSPIGMCGVLRRDVLEHPDIGFSFLERHIAKGYGRESAAAVLAHARQTLNIRSMLAITSLDNTASIALLSKLGFVEDRVENLPGWSDLTRVFILRA